MTKIKAKTRINNLLRFSEHKKLISKNSCLGHVEHYLSAFLDNLISIVLLMIYSKQSNKALILVLLAEYGQ